MTPFPYILIRTSRKTLSLTLSREGDLIVRSPMRMKLDVIERFIELKSEWILKHRKIIEKRNQVSPHKTYSSKEVSILKSELYNYIVPRVHELWRWKNLPSIKSLKITKSEWRWWSCSGKNWLCFSYRLAEFITHDPLFIDAIIIHELAHLIEKNHQKPFWNLVYSWMPQYDMIIKKQQINE